MKIAFVAMSGIRTYDPELVSLGLELPGFVERGKAIASLPSLSLLTLAGATPERHEVSYYEVDDVGELMNPPDADLVAFGTFTAQVKEAYELSDRYRAQGVPTVMGGLHVTSRPQEALRHCDAVVIGEGELTWPRLLADFEAGRMQPIYSSFGEEFDLAEAPMPRFDLLEVERYNRLTVQTQRGCPWRCEFCASSILLTPKYKLKPVDKVVSEIRRIKEIWDRPFVEFADDNTFVNKRHGRELMRAIADEDVRWFTETDISVADDPELLRMMHDAGCAEVLIGFESPGAAGLDGVELRRNWKRGRMDRYEAAVERIQSHGIAVNACFVLGLDGDGPEVFDAVESFVSRTGPFDVQITVPTPFPGTPMYERFRADGRLLADKAWERCTLFDVNFTPERMTALELRDGLVDLARRLYSEEAKRARRGSFKQQSRTGRSNARRLEEVAV